MTYLLIPRITTYMAKRKTKNVYFTPEPDWQKYTDFKSEEDRQKAFRECDYFARTEIKDKLKVEHAKTWIKEKSGWSSKDIKIILANPDWAFTPSGGTFYVESKLGYIPERILNHIHSRKEEWIKRGKKELAEKVAKAEEKKEKPKISIQDRMKDQISDLCGDMEFFLDEMIDGNKTIKEFDPYKMMLVYQPEIKVPHAKLLREEFARGHEEALEVIEWKDEQIKEAYSNFSLKERKAYLEYYEKINTACDTMIQTKAVKRKARKPKARSKEKIVQKLKFKINEPELGLASVTPTDVVYANECWVYNTKTRKLGVYHARSKDPRALKRDGAGLMVKGTTIQEFCEESSIQKTLRKPKEQLKPFVAGAKTACNKNFEAIKTTDTKMNGRLNEHIIILKTF